MFYIQRVRNAKRHELIANLSTYVSNVYTITEKMESVIVNGLPFHIILIRLIGEYNCTTYKIDLNLQMQRIHATKFA